MSEYRELYNDDDYSDPEDNSSYRRCTKRKTLTAYFRLKLRKDYIDNQLRRLNSLTRKEILRDYVGYTLFKRYLKNEPESSMIMRLLKCYFISSDLLSSEYINTDDERITKLILFGSKEKF